MAHFPNILLQTQVHPVVNTWKENVLRNGGSTPGYQSIKAVDRFYRGLIDNGLLGSMVSVNCYVPDSLISAITPLIPYSSTSVWTNNNFLAGNLSVKGLKGNGTSMWLDTQVNAFNAFTTTSCGASVYISESIAEGNNVAVGSGDAGSNQFALTIGGAATSPYYYLWDSWNWNAGGRMQYNEAGATGKNGFFCANRVGLSTASYLYQANSTTPFNTIPTVEQAGTNIGSPLQTWGTIWAHGFNLSNAYAQGCDKTISFLALHQGMTISMSNAFYNIVQQLRIDLGGGWI